MNHASEISNTFKGFLSFLVYVRMLSLEVIYFCSFKAHCLYTSLDANTH